MEIIKEVVQVQSNAQTTVSIGARSRELIKQGLSNTTILETIKKEFPNGKTTMACIAWYKSDMRKKGLLAKRGYEFKTVYKVKNEDGTVRDATAEEVAEIEAAEADSE